MIVWGVWVDKCACEVASSCPRVCALIYLCISLSNTPFTVVLKFVAAL